MADASSLSGPEPPGDGIKSDAIIQVAPTLGGVRLLGAALRGMCLQVLPEDEASEMELALVEAATNIVKHAFSGMTGGQLSAELKIGETFVEVDGQWGSQLHHPSWEQKHQRVHGLE